jgi:hypothetical protein
VKGEYVADMAYEASLLAIERGLLGVVGVVVLEW